MRIKIVLYYLLEFMLSLIILLLFLIFTLKFTLLNPKYILKELKKNNYYSELSKSINSDMSNYVIQAGLEDEVLKDIYTEEMVTKELKYLITSFYQNKEMKIDNSVIKKNLEANIIKYLEKNNLEITDQQSLDRFVDQILDVYHQKMILSDSIPSMKGKVVKVNSMLNILTIILLFLSSIIALTVFFYLKKEALAVPLFMTGILSLLGNYFLFTRIDVAHILFWNDSITKLIKSIIYNLSSITKISAFLFLILGVVFSIVAMNLKKEKIPRKGSVNS